MSIIKLIHGSCADQEVDAVVNAANRQLMSGGGICGAIFKKAGYIKLNKACKEYKLPLNDGDAVITPAFNMNNARNIIHAVGPNFGITPNAFDKLNLAYYNSMKLLKDKFLYSISFPLISSGIFRGRLENPVRESTKQCIEAYIKYNESHKEHSIKVLLCAYTENEYNEALKIFKEYKLDNLVVDRCKKLNILTDTDIATWHQSQKDGEVIRLGFPEYNENVMEWIQQMYDFDLTDQNYLENYNTIKDKNIDELSIDEILSYFTYYIRGERFCDGMIDGGIKNNVLVKLSSRLNSLVNNDEV